MPEVVLVNKESVDDIRDQEDLCQVVDQCHGEVEVCISTARVDPQVPENGTNYT